MRIGAHSLEDAQMGARRNDGVTVPIFGIARTIAEAHDGTLSATDRLDGRPGACLVLDLPLRQVGA